MDDRSKATIEVPPPRGASAAAVRKAAMPDVPRLLSLINGFAARGIMLPRTEFEIAENLRDFTVVEWDGRLAGCGALHFYSPAAAEVRSLAVAPECQGIGAGRRIVEALEQEARGFGIASLFAFTYIPDFFARLGFHEIDRGELPLKAWKDCLRCPKFQCCDEIAVIKQLSSARMGVPDTRIRGVASPLAGEPAELLRFP